MKDQEIEPLYVFVWENVYWCTQDKKEIPFNAEVYTMQATRDRVEDLLSNSEQLKTNALYRPIIVMLERRYRNRIKNILDDLPDINGSECGID